MPAKVSADKQAWLWAESTRPENVTEENVLSAYRLDQRRCKSGACRRNCRANPYCLTGLGEKIWLGEIDERQWHDIEDPNNERRTAGSFVGLKNLGATCYVNTFLQLWFHNPEVRRAMYMWHDPAEPADPSNNSVESKPEDWSPTTVCGQLQLTFALLEFSNRRYIDPTSFINCLGLNAAEQQDAQEFSKLFLSVLEDNLSEHADLRVQSLIQQQFCGGYAYLTRCSVCKSESRTPSKFFELDLNIKGNKTVEACIEEFLKVEKLDGDNQYMCETCNKKQNATREICLEKLPKVLNLQLLRFVFDRTTGHKKKLNSCIQFGEVLDVSKYIGKPEGTMVYHLTAVLIHRGPSAYSGHYVAHIKDTPSKTWYKFNDEEIEKMEGRKLKLGTEDELPGADGDKQTKRPRMAKGAHSSKNAYMLVYTHWEEGPPNSEEPAAPRTMESLLSERVQACVRRDNQRLEDYILELITMREQNIQNGRVKQEVVRQIYTDLSVKEGGGFEWLSLDWISKWLTDPSTAPPLDHSSFLCPHGRLDPDKISKLKCVSELGAEQLFDRYSGGPRLKNSGSLCWKCVRLRCDSIQTRLAMEADSRFISAGLKADCDSEDSYWVGKSSLRSWRRLSTERLNAMSVRKKGENTATKPNADGCSPLPSNWDQADSPGEPGPSEQRTMDEDDSRVKGENPGKDNQTDESGDAKVKEDTMPDGATKFNEDILCELHGNLSPDPSCRRLVSAEVWERLRSHFPTCPEYRKSASICLQCQSLTQQEQEAKVLNKKLATEQKSALLNVFFDRNRPSWQQKGMAKLFVVSAQSLEEWRHFIRDPLRKQALNSLSNDILVCPHAGLLYQPYSLTAPLDHRLYLLRPDEWSTLREHLPCDPEIKVCCTPNEDGSQTVTVTPAVCEDCRLVRMAQEEEDRYRYEDAVIYVRKLVLDKCSAPVSNINNASKLIAEREDPEFICAPDGGLKRKKPLQENGDVPQKLPHLQESSRKSNRHRRMRGEKEVTISSSQTLKELKVKIMKAFSVPPFDQTLSVDGRLLSDDTATVGGLRVPPGAIILLKADEPADDAMIIEDLYKVSGAPESGFKGTGLLSR